MIGLVYLFDNKEQLQTNGLTKMKAHKKATSKVIQTTINSGTVVEKIFCFNLN